GTINLTADTMALNAQIGGSAAATGKASHVNLAPTTAGQAISLGAGAATGLALTDADLNQIRAKDVAVGSVSAGAITLDGAFTATTGGQGLNFFGTVDAATAGVQGLTVAGSGLVSFLGAVGGSQALASLTVTGATVLSSNVTTIGAQIYNSAVKVGGADTL